MLLDAHFYTFAIPAVIIAGLSKGGFGSAAGFAATPFLALILTPAQAVGLMLPLLVVMDITAVKLYWKKWDKAVAGAMIFGAAFGILLGSLLYKFTDPLVFKLLIGISAVAYVAYQMARKYGILKVSPNALSLGWGRFWGAIAGFTSFIAHAGGPPASIFLLSRKLDKTTFQATTAIVFWVMNAAKIIPYTLLGIFNGPTLFASLTLFPIAVIGVLIGRYLHKRVSETFFFAITYVFLTITGIKLIWDALA